VEELVIGETWPDSVTNEGDPNEAWLQQTENKHKIAIAANRGAKRELAALCLGAGCEIMVFVLKGVSDSASKKNRLAHCWPILFGDL
jgi:hypothetical protein